MNIKTKILLYLEKKKYVSRSRFPTTNTGQPGLLFLFDNLGFLSNLGFFGRECRDNFSTSMIQSQILTKTPISIACLIEVEFEALCKRAITLFEGFDI